MLVTGYLVTLGYTERGVIPITDVTRVRVEGSCEKLGCKYVIKVIYKTGCVLSHSITHRAVAVRSPRAPKLGKGFLCRYDNLPHKGNQGLIVICLSVIKLKHILI